MIARVLLAVLLVLCTGGSACADATRPNALDRSVDTIPASALLAQPAPKLIDPAREAAAERLEGWRAPVWTAMLLLQIGALAWFWQSGLAARWRDRFRRTTRGEFAVRFCFGALLAAIAKLAALIPQALEYRMWRIMGISTQTFGSWLGDWLLNAIIVMIVAGFVAAVVLWLADWTHQWYLYTIAGVFAVTFALAVANPLFVAPFFSRQVDPPLDVVRSAESLASRAGLHGVTVREVLIATRARGGSAYVSGLGPTERIVISDTLIAGATADEVAFILARQIAHIKDGDPVRYALVQALIVIFGAAIAVFIADRVGFRRDDDPVSRLALVAALLGCAYLVGLPLWNSYERHREARADRLAATLTSDPAAGIRAIVRGADQDLIAVCPNRFSLWYFGAQPPTAQRIAALQGRSDACP
ncbi:MAG: M48 family metalloprotease [Vulcanimicrobiaceae bacterium]